MEFQISYEFQMSDSLLKEGLERIEGDNGTASKLGRGKEDGACVLRFSHKFTISRKFAFKFSRWFPKRARAPSMYTIILHP